MLNYAKHSEQFTLSGTEIPCAGSENARQRRKIAVGLIQRNRICLQKIPGTKNSIAIPGIA